MPWSTFAELTKQVHLLHDIILEDMVYAQGEHEHEVVEFTKHLFSTKNWFTRISAPNKKRFLLALLQDITSAWAVARLLLCIWNCWPKDAVLSASEYNVLSSYDQMPMDHNRTASPMGALTQIMKSDRKWFLSLEPENQALVICELLTVSGGPVMLEILKRALVIFERYRKHQLDKLINTDETADPLKKKVSIAPAPLPQGLDSKTKEARRRYSASKLLHNQSVAQKKLNEHLAQWDTTIQTMKDNLNLKEIELTFNDGTKTNIWHLKRTNPQDIETVDVVQLLPSAISKKILSYLPPSEFPEYSRVNEYWAWLVEELKAEMATRVKLDADIRKLKELALRNDPSIDSRSSDFKPTSMLRVSMAPSFRQKTLSGSILKTGLSASMKSAGAYSFRHFINEKLTKQLYAVHIPIHNMADLSKRLTCRGALDENLWGSCKIILEQRKAKQRYVCNLEGKECEGGVMVLGNVHFPCPLMTRSLKLPLNPPLVKDFTMLSVTKPNRNISNATVMSITRNSKEKRLRLWSRNLSNFYHATKVPSYCNIGK